MKLSNMYSFPLHLLLNKIIRIYSPALEELGLTYVQNLAMICLWEQDGQKVTEIGRTLRCETGVLTPILQKLEKLGHIRRERQSDDKRIVRIYLTDKGRRLHDIAKDRYEPLFAYGERVGCSKEDLDDLRDSVKRILDKFDQIPESTWGRVGR